MVGVFADQITMPPKIRRRDVSPRSFENSSWLPGTAGNPFDTILNAGSAISKIPGIAFFIILALLASLVAWTNLLKAALLLAFMLLDWLMISLLPKTHLSFGPVKPVVLVLAVLRAAFGLLSLWPALVLQTIGTLLVIIGFYLEPQSLDVHSETLETSKIPQGLSFKVVHLGDLHIERLTRREQKILQVLEAEKPDLILFSGDVLNLSYVQDETAQSEARDFLRKLHAPMGVFAVTGSPPVDPPEVFAKTIAGTPLQWLNNQVGSVQLGETSVQIVGLTCTHLPERDLQMLQTFYSPDPAALSILLYHSPDLAPMAASQGFDLQLSGHTHGGQVRLPFFGALYAASLYGKLFESGRYLLKDMTLYVTRGLGMEGGIAPRVRLFCRPELIVWTLAGKD